MLKKLLIAVLLCVVHFSNGQSYDSFYNTDNIILKKTVRLAFQTFHTQGLTKVGEKYFMTSVGVQEWPKRYPTPLGKYDRSTGKGTGYLFQFDEEGDVQARIILGRDSVYHPGGLDFDGKYLWIPVCEYRPKGKSWIYKVDAQTLEANIAIEVDDAIGAVVYDRDREEVIGMNWDARTLYRWKKGRESQWTLLEQTVNPHFLLNFQDGQYLGNGQMLLSGIRHYTSASNRVTVGGFQILQTGDYKAVASIYLPFTSEKGHSINNNPFFMEVKNDKVQLYAIPDDDQSLIYIYEVKK